jgi:hypothetical protein
MTRKEFLKLYHDLDNFNWLEGRKATNPEIFQITPEQIAELFPDRLEAVRYYRNIHQLDLDETLRLFPKKLVKISFECGYTPPLDGYCEVWNWKDGSPQGERKKIIIMYKPLIKYSSVLTESLVFGISIERLSNLFDLSRHYTL